MQNKLLISAIFILTLASGCATTTEPVINTVIQKVEVPIAMPCTVEIPPQREDNFSKVTTEMDIFEKVKALLADRKIQAGYEAELRAALSTCTGPVQPKEVTK